MKISADNTQTGWIGHHENVEDVLAVLQEGVQNVSLRRLL